MATSIVGPITLDQVRQLSRDMRPEDAAECLASGGYQPSEAISVSIDASVASWSMTVDGELLALFGIAHPGIPWALTSNAARRHPRLVHATARVVLDKMLERYPVLVQYVDARYTSALRWLRRLGFSVAEAEPFGIEGRPFHRIELRRQPCASQQPLQP